MDAIRLIRRDHQTVKALFRKFEKASASGQKQSLAQEIIEELSAHALVEEQLVYPLLRARDTRAEDAVLEALEEHHVAKLTLAELDKMKPDAERYEAKMHVLRESVEMHIEEEEGELLPRLERLLEADELKQLGEAILAMKKAAPTHPHPLAPDTPPGGAVAGAFAKVTDAAKDLLQRLTSPERTAGHKRVQKRASAVAARGQGGGGRKAAPTPRRKPAKAPKAASRSQATRKASKRR